GSRAGALRIARVAGAPVAVGTFIFASQGTAFVYGARAYGPSAETLRVFSFYVLPVSVNIALGTVLLASGKQLPWALCKAGMLIFAAAASFAVVPYWQQRSGNGGTGAAVMTVVAELGMTAAALLLLPRGLLRIEPWRDLGAPLAASAVMAIAGILLGPAPFLLALAGASPADAGALVAVGGAGRRGLEVVIDVLRRRAPPPAAVAAAPAPDAARPAPAAPTPSAPPAVCPAAMRRTRSLLLAARTLLVALAAALALAALLTARRNDAVADRFYTCPMHAEISAAAPGACPICGMALVRRSPGTSSSTLLEQDAGATAVARRRVFSQPVRAPAWVEDGVVEAIL